MNVKHISSNCLLSM